jgi:GNAT superfamily N-acetyltransferase
MEFNTEVGVMKALFTKLCYANDMNIRRAEPHDSQLLSSLCVEVQTLHARHYPQIFKMLSAADFAEPFFATQLKDPLTHIFVAEQDGQVIGYILCELIERPENNFTHLNRFVLIDQISVRPDKQGRGAGALLIAQARALAQTLGVKRIHLDT